MKTFIVILMVSVLAAVSAMPTDEMKAMFMDTMKQCATELKVPDEIIEKLKKHEHITSRDGKCFKACIMEKMGILGADNKISKDTMMDHAKTLMGNDDGKLKQVSELIDECNQHAETDKCEAANKICECIFMHKEAPILDNIM